MKKLLTITCTSLLFSCSTYPAFAAQDNDPLTYSRGQYILGVAAEGRDNALVANNRLLVVEPKLEQALGQSYNASATSEAALQVGNTAIDHARNAQTEADKAAKEAARAHQRIDELNDYVNASTTDNEVQERAGVVQETESITADEARAYVDDKVSDVSKKVDRAERRVSAGVAGVAALATIPYLDNKVSLGAGVGHFNGQSAAALGVQSKIGSVRLRAGVASDSQNNFTAAAGVAIGF